MKFVADESVDLGIIRSLRKTGHEVVAIVEIAPRADDASVLSLAHAANAILVTGDKDFGELVFRRGQHSSGILLLRLAGLSAESKADVVLDVIHEHGASLSGRFAVLTPGQFRIRGST